MGHRVSKFSMMTGSRGPCVLIPCGSSLSICMDSGAVAISSSATMSPELQVGEITTNDVASYPLPGCVTPSQYHFSPDDKYITYLRSTETSLTKQLYAFNPATGEETLLVHLPERGTSESLTETLRRERQRILDVGVTHYSWAGSICRLMVPLNGGVYVQDGIEPLAPLRCLIPGLRMSSH